MISILNSIALVNVYYSAVIDSTERPVKVVSVTSNEIVYKRRISHFTQSKERFFRKFRPSTPEQIKAWPDLQEET